MQILPGTWTLGFVCGSLRCLGALRASEQEEVGDCPENYLTLRRDLSLPQNTENLCSIMMCAKIVSLLVCKISINYQIQCFMEMDSHDPVLLGTLMVVGLRAILCLVNEPPLLSTVC